MATKAGSVTVKVPFVVETANKADLAGAIESAKMAIANRIIIPKRVSVQGAKVSIG